MGDACLGRGGKWDSHLVNFGGKSVGYGERYGEVW